MLQVISEDLSQKEIEIAMKVIKHIENKIDSSNAPNGFIIVEPKKEGKFSVIYGSQSFFGISPAVFESQEGVRIYPLLSKSVVNYILDNLELVRLDKGFSLTIESRP